METEPEPAEPRRAKLPGPEELTLTERIIEAIHLPYAAGCVAVGLLIGTPGFLLLGTLETGSFATALDISLSNSVFSITHVGQRVSLAQSIAESVLWTLFLILTLYFTRSMRLRMVRAESRIAHLMPRDTAGTFYRAFGGITRLRYALPIVAAFLVLYLPARLAMPTGMASLVLLPLDFLFIGVALWLYLRALWGIYRFGKEDLTLRPFTEDRMLGLRPLGSISLSFSVVFLTLDVIALAGSFVSEDPSNLVVQFGLLALLVSMLFLPLLGIHRKMVAARKQEEARLQARLVEVAERAPSGGELDALIEIRNLVTLRTLRKEAAKIPTWPFDAGRLERFIAVFLSVVAIVTARLIQVVLQF